MNPNVLVKINALDNTKEAFNALKRNLEGVHDAVGVARKRLDDLQPTFQKMVAAGTVAFGAVSLGASRAIQNATALGESINAVQVVFGGSADQVLRFGETAAKTVGISNSAFNQMATQTGALLRDTGLSMDQVANQTIILTQRAADMASVFNTSVDDALSAINQALRGETEAIRRYAGNVTDAQIETYLLSKGIDVSVASMTEQEKRLVRLEVIMQQTAVTAGDFQRTIGSVANQNRVLGSQTEDASARIGNALLPVLQRVQAAIRPVLDTIAVWIERNPELTRNIIIATGVIAGLTVAVGALGIAVGVLLSPVGLVVAALGVLAGAVFVVTRRWESLPIVFKAVLLPIKLAVEWFQSAYRSLIMVGDAITWVYNKVTGTVASAAIQTSASVINLQATVDELIDPLAGQSRAIDSFSTNIKGLGSNATETADKLKKLREEASQIFKDTVADEADYKRNFAETIIEQEESIKDKKAELRRLERSESESDNSRQIDDLRRTIAEEQSALESVKGMRLQFAAEIEEAERRASLTAFERKIEDLQRERLARLNEQLLRMQEIQNEITAERAKSNAIAGAFGAAQETMRSAIAKTREVAETEAERMKKAFDRVLSSMSEIGISRGTNRISFGSVSALTGRATGGPVVGRKPYIVGENGPELFVPNNSGNVLASPSFAGAGTAPINVIITNNSFMGERDMVERVGDQLIRIIKNNGRL